MQSLIGDSFNRQQKQYQKNQAKHLDEEDQED